MLEDVEPGYLAAVEPTAKFAVNLVPGVSYIFAQEAPERPEHIGKFLLEVLVPAVHRRRLEAILLLWLFFIVVARNVFQPLAELAVALPRSPSRTLHHDLLHVWRSEERRVRTE